MVCSCVKESGQTRSLVGTVGQEAECSESVGQCLVLFYCGAFQVVLVVKNPPADTVDLRAPGMIPGSGRFPGGGHDTPLQRSCLGNPPVDSGAWRAAVHRVARSQTRLKRLSTQARCSEDLEQVKPGQREELMKSKQLFCCEIPCSGGEERTMEAQTDI